MTVFISSDAARDLLQWPLLIPRLRAVYAVPHGPQISAPRAMARGPGIWTRALTAIPPGCRFMGAKLFGMGRSRECNYLIALFEQETGNIAALIDGHVITAMRTAATSAVAVAAIAPLGPVRLGVLGSGLEAKMHVRAIGSLYSPTQIKIYSPSAANRTKFAEECTNDLGIPAEAVTQPKDAVIGSTIVLAAARSKGEEPILYGDWLEAGAIIVSIGSTIPEQREIDVSVVQRCAQIICDSVDEVVHHTGDMRAAEAAGIQFSHKLSSLNDVVMGKCRRQESSDIYMFKSVGSALQDIVAAEVLYEQAMASNRTSSLPIEFLPKHA